MLQELVIKVPAPFLGRADVGFSTRYPAQPAQAPLKDVPFFIEGPPGPMRRLQSRLELFRQKRSLIPDAPGEAYSWTDLIPLNDELFILAYRDESLTDGPDDAESEHRYILNLVRSLVFPFLRDCVRIGELALMPHDFPALRHGQAQGVDLAEVIGMRFRRRRQWPHHRGGVAIGVSQRSHSGLETTRPRTLSYAPHDRER